MAPDALTLQRPSIHAASTAFANSSLSFSLPPISAASSLAMPAASSGPMM